MTDYNKIDENELTSLLYDGDESIKDIIFTKYAYIIDILVKKYTRVIHAFNIDEAELRQEASYGFSDGISSYSETKNTTLRTFLTLCIERRMKKYLKKYTSSKALALKESLSLEGSICASTIVLADVLSDGNKNNPLRDLTSIETVNEIMELAKEILSQFEYEVFEYMINGETYIQIADKLDKTPKQIDNTMQRIKMKMRKELKNID